jgi:hypothetical protein
VERKFQKKAYDENSEKYVRYSKVEWAYMKHREKFSEAYGEEDFYNIVAFQDCITGRSYETDTGGTGLTELIKVLEQSVDEHYCYMLSGDRGINFKLDLLGYNEDNWIGFNYSKDFIGDVPSDEAIIRTDTQIQGTAYNFSVVVRKEN